MCISHGAWNMYLYTMYDVMNGNNFEYLILFKLHITALTRDKIA